MRILVTGGAGFIGSHIVDKCIEKGFDTIVIDNLTTGSKINLNPKAVFYKDDIRSAKLLDILKEENIDIVIHQAAQVNVVSSIKDPLEDASINISGTINLLESCKKTHVKKIIYASSAAVYGEPMYLPIDEEHPINPQSGYGISKYTAETFIKLYKKLYGLDFTILRYSNVYGPRQDALGEAGVVAIFINKILKGEALTIFGDGKQTRDFIYVSDVVDANIAALFKGGGQVFNTSTGKQTLINELVELIKRSSTNVKVINGEERLGDIRHSFLNANKASVLLDWRANKSIESGVTNTMKVLLNRWLSIREDHF